MTICVDDGDNDQASYGAKRYEPAFTVVLATVLYRQNRPIEDQSRLFEGEPVLAQVRIVLGVVPLKTHCQM